MECLWFEGCTGGRGEMNGIARLRRHADLLEKPDTFTTMEYKRNMSKQDGIGGTIITKSDLPTHSRRDSP